LHLLNNHIPQVREKKIEIAPDSATRVHIGHPAATPTVHKILARAELRGAHTWTPAVAGDPDAGVPPILAGMHFHDLRHTHKTWLIEDDIPEVAQAKRLGHRLPGVRGIYSHVTPAMVQHIVDALEHRWTSAQSDQDERRAA
jgi:integrase